MTSVDSELKPLRSVLRWIETFEKLVSLDYQPEGTDLLLSILIKPDLIIYIKSMLQRHEIHQTSSIN